MWRGAIVSPKPVILDVDPGHDDAVALMLACGHPDLDLLAVTTVAGNVPIEKTTRNTLRVLALRNPWKGHSTRPRIFTARADWTVLRKSQRPTSGPTKGGLWL
jgi:hypothetical protein